MIRIGLTRSDTTRSTAALIGSIILMAALAPSMAGCLKRSLPQKQRYVLDLQRPIREADAGSNGVLRVGRVRMSPLFERKSFVYRLDEARYDEDFYHEFFAPPGVLIERGAREWLAASGLFADVVDGAFRGSTAYLLEAQVEELYGDLRDRHAPKAVAEVFFTLRNASHARRPVIFDRRYRAQVAVERRSPAALRAGWSEAFRRVFGALESDLRTLLDERR